jgi:uncharacterized membrane protein YesL
VIYTLLVVELLLLIGIVPGLAVLVLLDRNASNLPLAAACALPLGPALSAAVFALRHRRRDLIDLRPAAAFVRGYRLNFAAILHVWVPFLAWMTVIAVSLAHFAATGLPEWWAVLLVVVGAASLLVTANALVISSLFTFRLIDVVRLSAAFLTRTPGVTLGNLCLLVAATAVTATLSEAVLALLGSVFAALLLLNANPMIREIERDYTG